MNNANLQLYTKHEVNLYRLQTLQIDEFDLKDKPVSFQKFNEDQYIILSRFSDLEWVLPDSIFPSRAINSNKSIKFKKCPNCFVNISKKLLLNFLANGSRGSTIISYSEVIFIFLNYIYSLGVKNCSQINNYVISQFINYSRISLKSKNINVSTSQHAKRLYAVELLYNFLVNSEYSFPHPWPDSSSNIISGLLVNKKSLKKPSTPLIPDEIFSKIFLFCNSYLERSEVILDALNSDLRITSEFSHLSEEPIWQRRNANIRNLGFKSIKHFLVELRLLESACWWIVLATTGIRCHELCEIELNASYSKNVDGEIYNFLISRSLKTGEGITTWLCPEITIRALEVMKMTSSPLREALKINYENSLKSGKISKSASIKRYLNSIVLTKIPRFNEIKVASLVSVNKRLKELVSHCGLNWSLASHQGRRSFAHYVVHSALGDLRYLRDHFKHWSLDMTALYALDENLDIELFEEIFSVFRDTKNEIIFNWFDKASNLSGGLSRRIISLREKDNPIQIYDDLPKLIATVSDNVNIRSTTIAWCTNDSLECGGGNCDSCEHSVIDKTFQKKWESLYIQQLELRNLKDDVSPVLSQVIDRTIIRCEKVLQELGVNIASLKEGI